MGKTSLTGHSLEELVRLQIEIGEATHMWVTLYNIGEKIALAKTERRLRELRANFDLLKESIVTSRFSWLDRNSDILVVE